MRGADRARRTRFAATFAGQYATSAAAFRHGTALALLLAISGPAFADGGNGAGPVSGGADNLTAAGVGGNGADGGGAGPGGGGGGTGTGGGGSGGAGGNGAVGGTAPGGNGTDGAAAGDGGGGGGGATSNFVGAVSGGSFGAVTLGNGGRGGNGVGTGGGGGGGAGAFDMLGTESNGSFTVTGNRTAGNGGAGGTSDSSAGGGGGSGGFGIRLTGSGMTATIGAGASVVGGSGGAGGTGAIGGAGGAGGIALQASNATIINNGIIRGGDGGARGFSPGGQGAGANGGNGIQASNTTVINNGAISGGAAGQNGFNNFSSVAGAGIAGSNLTITNNGTIDYINLTGGTNVVSFGGAAAGVARFSISSGATLQTNAAAGGTTFSGQTDGAGALIQNSPNTMVLTGVIGHSGGTTINAGTLQLGDGVANTSLILGGFVNNATLAVNTAAGSFIAFTTQNRISGSGALNIGGAGTTYIYGNNTYTGATNVNSGTLWASNGNAIGDLSAVSVAGGATLGIAHDETIGSLAGAGFVGSSGTQGNVFGPDPRTLTTGGNNTSTVFSGVISDVAPGIFTGAGTFALVKTGSGTLSLSGDNTYSGGTTVNAGTLQLGNGGTTGSIIGDVTVNAGATFAINRSDNITLNKGVIGAGGFAQNGAGTTTFDRAFTYTGGTTVNAGTLLMSGAGTLGATSGSTRVNTGGTLNLGGTTQTQDGGVVFGGGTVTNGTLRSSGTFSGQGGSVGAVLAGSGAFAQSSGTTTLSAVNTYSGNTSVSGGRLVIAQGGSINSVVTVNGGTFVNNGTSLGATTINSGGTLGGNGIFGNTTISGGTLSPGNSIGTVTIQGNLVLNSAATYMVEIDPSGADRTNVSGTTTLGGARVSVNFASGTYVTRSYTILNAQGGVSGTFSSVVNTNLPTNFATSLRYDANNAWLDIALTFAPSDPSNPSGPTSPAYRPLTTNQRNVANGLINSFNTAGGIPLAFGALSPTGLTQVSGEHATAPQQTTFDAMDKFVNAMTDPFMGSRSGGLQGGALSFADEASAYASTRKGGTASEREAYAKMAMKAPPRALISPRWSVWGAGYGGTQSTDGDGGVGSQKLTSRVYGGAAGFDYRIMPDTQVGFALGGAGTTFSLANGLGGGRSEMFQAGLYGRHTSGPAYVSGAIAWGWQDITTNRTVFANGYRANFDANAITGRLEGGWRFAYGTSGITPYAAGQVTSFFLPGYAETLVAGANTFALAYAGKDVTASRTELGLRGDTSFTAADAIVTLRGRAAWAHNFNTDRSISALFQTLPASGFTVFGASLAQNSALVSAGADVKWLNGISVAATFEGEFSGRTESYAGKGTVRYQW